MKSDNKRKRKSRGKLNPNMSEVEIHEEGEVEKDGSKKRFRMRSLQGEKLPRIRTHKNMTFDLERGML